MKIRTADDILIALYWLPVDQFVNRIQVGLGSIKVGILAGIQ